jgi:hypothetical protein
MRGRRPSAGAVGALFLLAILGVLFVAGRCAGAATNGPGLPDQARPWIVLALILLGSALVWRVWRAIRRRFRGK